MRSAEQIRALDFAFERVRDWSVAIDGGAHRGDWSEVMSNRFEAVLAYEPADDMFAALQERFSGKSNVLPHRAALWNRAERVTLMSNPRSPLKTYGRYVRPGGDIDAIAIDDLALPTCGLIKLDLEGAEMPALRGAVETLKRCRPVVIAECKEQWAMLFGATADDPGRFLAELGAVEFLRHGPDRLYAWPA